MTNSAPAQGMKFVSSCPLPSEAEREILNILIEECAEVVQRATKMLRFGRDEVQEGQPNSNTVRLSKELGDLVVLIEMAEAAGLIDRSVIEERKPRKREKLAKYMQSGALTASPARSEAEEYACQQCGLAFDNKSHAEPSPQQDTLLIARLRAMAVDIISPYGKTLKHWDEIRHQVETRKGSDLPRLNFESLIEGFADLMHEAATRLSALSATELKRLAGIDTVAAEHPVTVHLKWIDAIWLKRHLDHYRLVIDAYSNRNLSATAPEETER